MKKIAALSLLSLLTACNAEGPPEQPPAAAAALTSSALVEGQSLTGEPLLRPEQSDEVREPLEENLAAARAAYEAAPDDPDAIIWLGRRLAYLGRYQEAIDAFSEGVAKHPDDARMLRHRGHRFITVRELDRAVEDFTRAAALIQGQPDEVEPDGAPNPFGIPTSTLHTNIWYHLGLAHYLRGEYEEALAAYLECLDAATNDDMFVATADWLYMTYRRLGRHEEAAALLERIHPEMTILENHAYHRRLMMYKGDLTPEALLAADADPLQMATQGYGVANWYLANGDEAAGIEILERVVALGNWAAFGHIAAEADLVRLGGATPGSE